MQENTTNLRIYGPQIPEAIKRLDELEEKVVSQLPIERGEISLGKYDYIYYWKNSPLPEPLLQLIEFVDESFEGLLTRYSITTEGYHTRRLTAEIEGMGRNATFSFVRIHGPSISKAIRAIEKVVEDVETTKTIQSLKSSVLVGEWDYAFEWDQDPSMDDVHALLASIDKLVEPTGALYKVSTLKNVYRTEKVIDDHSSENLMAFL
jgi:hypothetical protein